jgi:hypothetical protein
VPAAAVIPAPIAYIKVVAVKKLVVEVVGAGTVWRLSCCVCVHFLMNFRTVTLRKLECSKQALL